MTDRSGDVEISPQWTYEMDGETFTLMAADGEIFYGTARDAARHISHVVRDASAIPFGADQVIVSAPGVSFKMKAVQ